MTLEKLYTDLKEAFTGKTAQINIPVAVTCETCSGTGAKAGTKPKTCATCGGQGRVRQAQGFFTLERTCPGALAIKSVAGVGYRLMTGDAE